MPGPEENGHGEEESERQTLPILGTGVIDVEYGEMRTQI